jgi:hypothetical protein
MKQQLLIAAMLLIAVFSACTKAPVLNEQSSQAAGVKAHSAMNTTRLTVPNNSQSIPLDTANMMLNSYLTSVGYPYVDTAIRSLSFDADTLRAYLQNSSIVTIKFMLAHQQSYIHNGHNGEAAGFSPGAVTLLVVGMDDNQQYVLNSRNQVYDHAANCPWSCPGQIGEAYIH